MLVSEFRSRLKRDRERTRAREGEKERDREGERKRELFDLKSEKRGAARAGLKSDFMQTAGDLIEYATALRHQFVERMRYYRFTSWMMVFVFFFF